MSKIVIEMDCPFEGCKAVQTNEYSIDAITYIFRVKNSLLVQMKDDHKNDKHKIEKTVT